MSSIDNDIAPTPKESKQHKLAEKDILQSHSGLRVLPGSIETENEGQESGGQGEVTLAILQRGPGKKKRVAVKKLRYGDNYDNEKFSKSFVNEVDLLARLSHPNIVKLLGFLGDLENGEACMIFAWEENGNIQQFPAKRKCDVPERVSLVKDVTSGLEYLHTRQPPIGVTHGDLKSLNILINSSCREIIVDFGSARVLRKRPESKADRERVKPEATVPSRAGDSISSQISISVTVKDILENLSGLRILPKAIKTENEGQESGGQGEVTRAILKRGPGQRERVAVKKLRYGDDTDNEKFSKSFVTEVDILAGLSHPNIVKLLGFLEDLENGEACMIFAWEENGNVQQFLAKRKCDVPERVSLVKDVTAGLEYLHTRQPPICHGDLKSLNILVNSSCRGIITDFGSARALRKRPESKADRERVKPEATVPSRAGDSISSQISISVTGNQLTITGPKWSFRWAAPEIIMLDAVPDLPSDIWAIGWVIWEIITDKLPFHELSSDVAITKTFVEETDPSVGNDAQMSQIESLCALMRDCLSYDPTSRPTAAKCCTLVKWMPSTVPTSEMLPDLKDRSTTLLLSSGYMRYSQNDYTAAAALFNKALASAKSENDALSVADSYIWLGEVYLAQNWYIEAKVSFSEAHGIYTSFRDDSGLIRSLDGLGGVHYAQYRYHEAEKCFLDAEKICARTDDDVGRAQVLNELGAVLMAQHRYNHARECYVQALAIFDRVSNQLGQANSLSGLGSVDHAQRRYEEAMESFVRAESIYKRIGNNVGLADVLNGIAAAHLKRYRYSEARECYIQALDIHHRVGNHLGQANSLSGMGSVDYVQCRYEEATESFVKVESVHKRNGNDVGLADALNWIAAARLKQYRYSETRECYVQALAIFDNHLDQANSLTGLGSDVGLADALNGIAADHLKRGEYSEAKECYVQALEIHNRVGNHLGQANSLSGLGSVYYVQCRYEGAMESFVEAESIYKRVGNDVGLADALSGIAAAHLEQCRYSSAAECYVRAREIHNGVGNHLGQANSLNGLGSVDHAQRRSSHALVG